jgi:hypothetical protein
VDAPQEERFASVDFEAAGCSGRQIITASVGKGMNLI